MDLEGKRVALGLSGGGINWVFHLGVWKALRELGADIIECHGVSAGALATVLIIQDRFDEAVELAHEIMASDGHRWKTGPEIGWQAIRGKLDALALNDRLRDTLQRFIPDDIATRAKMPGFVGVVDVEWEEYLTIPHYAPDWLYAVWGSATIPNPLWKPVPWYDVMADKHRLLGDGGLHHNVPIASIYERIYQRPTKMLYCDLVVAVSCGTGLPEYQKYEGDIKDASLRTISMLTGRISWYNVRLPQIINNIMRQVEKTKPINDEDGNRYEYVPMVVVRPEESLGDLLTSSEELQAWRFAEGIRCAMKQLGATKWTE